jgi:protein gp37
MSDLFGIGIPEAWTLKVLKYIETEFEDRFYLLTKQPQNLQKFSPFPDNCWVGVSATNTNMAIDALQHLHSIQAKVKYLSLEPLLNRINTDFQAPLTGKTVIDWVIIGAQTKPYICPKSEWVAEILQNCNFGGIPVFLKNNLKQGLGVETLMQELPS